MTGTVVVGLPFLSVVGLSSLPLEVKSTVTATEGLNGGGTSSEVEIARCSTRPGQCRPPAVTARRKFRPSRTAAKGFVSVLLARQRRARMRALHWRHFEHGQSWRYGYIQDATAATAQGESCDNDHDQPVQSSEQTCTASVRTEYYTTGKKKGQVQNLFKSGLHDDLLHLHLNQHVDAVSEPLHHGADRRRQIYGCGAVW